MKLTNTEGVILAELLLKMCEDEDRAYELADMINSFLEPGGLIEENSFYVKGW